MIVSTVLQAAIVLHGGDGIRTGSSTNSAVDQCARRFYEIDNSRKLQLVNQAAVRLFGSTTAGCFVTMN